jgi:hypothetical protein
MSVLSKLPFPPARIPFRVSLAWKNDLADKYDHPRLCRETCGLQSPARRRMSLAEPARFPKQKASHFRNRLQCLSHY